MYIYIAVRKPFLPIWKPSKSFLDLYLSFSSGPHYTVDPFLFISSEMYR